jgi:hypothetical protein
MAQYQHLPIYKGTYDLLLRISIATKNFPREQKFTLGQKLRDEVLELIVPILFQIAPPISRRLSSGYRWSK